MEWICEGVKLYTNELQNLVQENEWLKLSTGMEEGYLVTPVVEVPPFTEISPSWNSKTSADSSVELLIRVRVGEDWSGYKSYGVWSADGNNKGTGTSEEKSDDIVRFTGDRIFIKDGHHADAVQIKVIFRGKEPMLRLIAFTTDAGNDEDVQGDYLQIIEGVPEISQLASGHKDSHVICSPTSVTMVLRYYGLDVTLEEVARGTYDNGSKVYGNWPQNVAQAGEMGMRAYTKKCISVNTIKNMISRGMPAVASVCVKDKIELDGAISAFPDGHLMVVIGFVKKDGEEYVVVNDPAANSNSEVRKEYKLNQWDKVWRHYIYVLSR